MASITETVKPSDTEIKEKRPLAEQTSQSEQSKFVQHLATYPALTALAGLIASFPVAKIFVSNAVPLLQAIHERSKPVAGPIEERAAPYLQKLDTVGDKALSVVDQQFPQLQRVQPSEVYEGAQNYIGSVKGSARAAYDKNIVNPLSSAASRAKNQYESIYDSRVGSYVAPINDKLESAIDQYLPAEGEANDSEDSTGSVNSQLRRTYSLARRIAERAAPKLKSVYDRKLDETSSHTENPNYIAKLLAAIATGKYLSYESYSLILNHFGTQQKLDAAVEQVKAKVAEARKQTQEIVEHASAQVQEAS